MAINAINAAGSSPTSSQVTDMLGINQELETLIGTAPSSLALPLRQVQLPFQQVADSLSSGGGRAVLNTGGVREGVLAIMTTCVSAGYHV